MSSFSFDVFLSHSSRDRHLVLPLAERLRDDGLRVWYAGWQIAPGDDVPAKIEIGLEQSRVLVLCLSANAYETEWAQLEAETVRFRDPLNQERRFIPLRFDAAPLRDSLAQFLYIDWRRPERDGAYAKLYQVCRGDGSAPRGAEHIPSTDQATGAFTLDHSAHVFGVTFRQDGQRLLTGSEHGLVRVWDLNRHLCLQQLAGHTDLVRGVAWSPDGRHAISGGNDKTVRLWDVETGECVRLFDGHSSDVRAVSWTSDRHRVASAAKDGTVRIWDTRTGACLQCLGVNMALWSIACSQAGLRLATGAKGGSIHVWNLASGRCERVLEGHAAVVRTLAMTRDGHRMISGSDDCIARVWDLETGRCVSSLVGHTHWVRSAALNSEGSLAITGAWDNTVRVWDVRSQRCLHVLKGHSAGVRGLMWMPHGTGVISCDSIGHTRVWDLKPLLPSVIVPAAAPGNDSVEGQVQYTNAKVLLVGDPGVGKTGLCQYLARGTKVRDDQPLLSTDGAWATQWRLDEAKPSSTPSREIWLWDFAGQVDYRLVHQLFVADAAAAVFVFNPQDDRLFEGLSHWDGDLARSSSRKFAKLLVAGRIDRGSLVVSAESVRRFMEEHGFLPPLCLTSARTGEGGEQLRQLIVDAIDWSAIPETTSRALYARMKREILKLRDDGLVLIRLAELKQRMQLLVHEEGFGLREIEAVLDLLASPGLVQRLEFGGFVLLRPEVLSRYAAAVVRKIRRHPHGLGCIREEEILAGDLDYQDFQRLPREDEAVVLRALLDTFVDRAWCLRQACDGAALLAFPSYFLRERPEQPDQHEKFVSYRFDGPQDEIYATLAVRLHHSTAFVSTDFWRAAADFKTRAGARLGFTLTKTSDGGCRLEVYFDPTVDPTARVLFLRYIHDHLIQNARNVVRLRHYSCSNRKCACYRVPFSDQAIIERALGAKGRGKVFCPACGKAITLIDLIEEQFESAGTKAEVRALQATGQEAIDSVTRELLAVHHTGYIVAEAGQIYRGYTNGDYGIDGEIEFRDAHGQASGRRLYVQLKSGDSYLLKRRRDGAEIFRIKKSRWADYWQQQAYEVMLVIRSAAGDIRWMNVSEYLRRACAGGGRVRQIVFSGERLDVPSIARWRDRLLGMTPKS